MDKKIQKCSHKCYACSKRCTRGLLLSQKTFFFSEGIKKLVQQWKKCTEKHGDYVEKLCFYKFSVFIETKFVSVVRLNIDSHTYFTLILRVFTVMMLAFPISSFRFFTSLELY